MEIILDKSFLDNASPRLVNDLCNQHTVILSEHLFYELMTTRSESRTRCFAKLPDRTDPVTLIPRVSTLLAFERTHLEPCVRLTRHRIPDTFVFHRGLRDGSYVLKGETLQNLENWRTEVGEDTRTFMERSIAVHQFFPELSGIEWKMFPKAVQTARRKAAVDTDFVRSIYASLDAPADAVSANRIDPNWAHYRWLQCQLLASLRLFGRYQGRMPKETGGEFWTRVEHSMHDVYYVILGSLADGLASLDNEIREDLTLVNPRAVLWPPLLRGE